MFLQRYVSLTIPVAVICLFTASNVIAQSTAGRFSGTVTDPSGTSVPQVRVTALNTETGQKLVETTNMQGQFVLYPLAPGTYDVTAQKEGFTTFALSGLKVDVS